MTPLELAAALEPLHRAYLRRLDEMVARLPRETTLREATTRGPDGRLAMGDDGLALCFDVADSVSGETFEVRGATPDAPASDGGAWGALSVKLLPGNWEALPIACEFSDKPRDADVLELAELIRAWSLVCAMGAFARFAPEPSGWSGRLHSLRVEQQAAVVRATLDMGSLPPIAVAALLSALEGLGRDTLPLVGVTIGGPADEPE